MTFTAVPTVSLSTLTAAIRFRDLGVKYLRITDDQEGRDMVDNLVWDAMGRIEEYCRQPIFARPYVITLKGFIDGRLPGVNVSSLTIHYKTDLQAESFTLLSDTLYTVSDEWFICFGEVPEGAVLVEIRYTGGYVETPGGVRTALLWQLTDLYDNRSDGRREVPQKSEVYLDPHRLSLL